MSRRFLETIAALTVIAGSLWIGSASVTAKASAQPSVSVVTFEGSGTPREVRDAMADELAARLVDGGHVRVLRREWLPHAGIAAPTLDALRAAAQSVNVDYLIVGSIYQVTNSPRRSAHTTTVVVDVRVVDVISADVVRTATAQRTYASNTKPAAPLFMPFGPAPVRIAAAIVTLAARSKRPSTGLNKDWSKAVQDVARQLDVRPIPALNRR